MQIRLADVTGKGSLEVWQNNAKIAVFEVNSSVEKLASTRVVALNPSPAVFFKAYGSWQGKLLDWQIIPAR